jgi:osmoprotectant transport system permease protein
VSVLNYFIDHFDKIIKYTLSHLLLIGISISLSLIIWISVGIAIRNRKNLAKSVMGIGSFIMAIPSVSLYGILMTIPGFGLSIRSAIFALLLYSMIPIVRNVYTALNQVDPAILEAARGMGMPKNKILIKVQLPLALPVIFAGIRVALVMMVGIATLAVFIGEQNLGCLIYQGIVRTKSEMIIVGAIMVSLIAVGVDLLMGVLKKKLVSPGLLIHEAEEDASEEVV